MGGRPSKPGSIARLRERKKASDRVFYYYDTGGKDRKEIPLDSDYGLAIMEYAKLERDRTATDLVAKVITFRYVAEKYMVDIVPTKGTATQAGNKRELKNLIAFFDDPPAPLETIEPLHVRQYLTWRKAAPVRANREKALLSAIWNYARDKGYTSVANPCAGIKGNKETGRDTYVARQAAGVEKSEFQMRDLRAKAGTDKAESSADIMQARDQLGHTTAVMTEQYIRNRMGKKVTPTK